MAGSLSLFELISLFVEIFAIMLLIYAIRMQLKLDKITNQRLDQLRSYMDTMWVKIHRLEERQRYGA